MTTVASALSSLYLGPIGRASRHANRASPLIVANEVIAKYATYLKSGTTYWSDFPTATSAITWGDTVDGGQWFKAATTAGGIMRVWAQFNFTAVAGENYILSFSVDSKTGTIGGGQSVAVTGVTTTGTSTSANPAIGRHGLAFTATASGTATVRLGIGSDGNNNNNADITYSKVMLERIGNTGRIYPYQYVNAGDQRAFPHTYSATMTGTLINVETIGTDYAVPGNSSVLVIGDSMTNDLRTSVAWGDFPDQMRYFLKGQSAIMTRGVAGETLSQTLTQFNNYLSETSSTTGVTPAQICVSQGGTNDVNVGRTASQMETDKIAVLDAIITAGMTPISLNIPPLNGATGGQQTAIDAYNSWHTTYCSEHGILAYDFNADANDGANAYKTSWGSSDGVHPGGLRGQGSYQIARRVSELVRMVA